MTTYQNFCETITKQLFDIIDSKGSLLSWQKNWDNFGCGQLPVGANGLYHGANLLSLLAAQHKEGFKSHQWFTFNQIKQKGGSVKKGAKSQTVFFWKLKETEEAVADQTVEKITPIFKTYHVFNLEQSTLDLPAVENRVFEKNAIDELVSQLGVSVSHFGSRAYYRNSDDVIVLPQPAYFSSSDAYFATLCHEIIHNAASRIMPSQNLRALILNKFRCDYSA